MKDLLNKLSSYNLFTNLLPGIIFIVILREITNFDLIFEPIFLGLFLYYFIGVVINRIGSLVIEPILKKFKFITFIDYPKYVHACKLDNKIEILSENNNMCRCIITVCLCLILAKVYEWLASKIDFVRTYEDIILIIILLIIFLFSYRKQTNYVVKRCNANLNK